MCVCVVVDYVTSKCSGASLTFSILTVCNSVVRVSENSLALLCSARVLVHHSLTVGENCQT